MITSALRTSRPLTRLVISSFLPHIQGRRRFWPCSAHGTFELREAFGPWYINVLHKVNLKQVLVIRMATVYTDCHGAKNENEESERPVWH
jgi:hypothetical protein